MRALMCCALLAFTGLCGALTYAVLDVRAHLDAALSSIDAKPLLTDVHATAGKVNGEIDEMHRLTLEAGLTAMEARKASVKESAYLDQANAQVTTVASDVHHVMVTTQETVAALQPVALAAAGTLATTQSTIASLEPVITHVDALVTSPDITGTLSHVESTTAHVDATAADVQQEVHSLTHPTWAHRIWGWTLDVARVFPL